MGVMGRSPPNNSESIVIQIGTLKRTDKWGNEHKDIIPDC